METQETLKPADVIAALGLTVDAMFVPFSKSRNKDEKTPSLNWIVTLKRNGREILKTDYMAGMAHCPSYNVKWPAAYDRNPKYWRNDVCAKECEIGYCVRFFSWNRFTGDQTKPILPDPVNVIYSLQADAGAIDYATFEGFADEYGYECDSRKGESVYRACLEIGLKLRAAIGEAGLMQLREAFQDY